MCVANRQTIHTVMWGPFCYAPWLGWKYSSGIHRKHLKRFVSRRRPVNEFFCFTILTINVCTNHSINLELANLQRIVEEALCMSRSLSPLPCIKTVTYIVLAQNLGIQKVYRPADCLYVLMLAALQTAISALFTAANSYLSPACVIGCTTHTHIIYNESSWQPCRHAAPCATSY